MKRIICTAVLTIASLLAFVGPSGATTEPADQCAPVPCAPAPFPPEAMQELEKAWLKIRALILEVDRLHGRIDAKQARIERLKQRLQDARD